MARLPNLFILGAPKCGTTSLAHWLSEHPNVFMCSPKEPYFFSTDIKRPRAAYTFEQYKKLFLKANENHLIVGEASTNYLRSKVAVPNILRYFPEAKFIVCLRNPCEMAISAHTQLVKTGRETVREFIKAWNLQEDRSKGKYIPWFTQEPSSFQYRQNCLLGEQVERLLSLVPKSSVHFVFLEDMTINPKQEYTKVLEFLNLPCDARESFSKQNFRSLPRNATLPVIFNLFSITKASLGIRAKTGLIDRFRRAINLDVITEEKELNDKEIKSFLINFFREDILKLEQLTGKDLADWIS